MSDCSELINKIAADHTTAVKIEKLGGLSQKITQSDKLGYNWVEDYVGETLVKQTYVKQENPVGVADNPFEFTEGVMLIPNAYYTHNGKRYVYISTESKTATGWDDSEFEEF
jgi:hypothetical protein